MLVRSYRNLNRGNRYSIQTRRGPDWRTVAWADTLVLSDCYFSVSAAGRLYAQRNGRQVHAWVVGTLICWTGILRDPTAELPPCEPIAREEQRQPWLRACYDPFTGPASFRYHDTQEPLLSARRAMLSTKGGLRVLPPL